MGTERRGQAAMELAAGLFALALVVSALCGFAVYIAKSLTAQNTLRSGNGGTTSRSDRVEVGEFASEHIFGTSILRIHEKIVMPAKTIMR